MAAIQTGRQERDGGAAAVEFALVTPLLLMIVCGIINYGIWFADVISERQAVRDAARQAVVEQFGSCGGGVTDDLQNLACTVKSDMQQIAGTTHLKIGVAPSPDQGMGVAWAQGATLRVCAATHHQSLLPFVPFPNGGVSQTRVDMPIESASGINLPTGTPTVDPPSAGAEFASWCR
jgi:hypothetical protein